MTPRPADPCPPAEVPLLGGTANRGAVFRVGDTVRRPARPTTPATAALLDHLASVGFEAPRHLGLDEHGREVVSYVPGQAVTLPYPAWALDRPALVSVARLLRRFADAVEGFDPSPHTWPSGPPPAFAGPAVAHNDPNLDNVVFRDGRAVALIDFDLAAPAARVWDVGAAARLWAPLRPADTISDRRRADALERFRVFVDAYGLDAGDRARVVAAAVAHHDWAYRIVERGAEQGRPGFRSYWTQDAAARTERTRTWLERSSPQLRDLLG
jgi:hypothetical protein